MESDVSFRLNKEFYFGLLLIIIGILFLYIQRVEVIIAVTIFAVFILFIGLIPIVFAVKLFPIVFQNLEENNSA